MKRFTLIKNGFTLVELLVVVSIIGILMALSIFGLRGAREAARDSKRKADLQTISSGLELFKSDCVNYPTTAQFNPNTGSLMGTTAPPAACANTNTYVPGPITDPLNPTNTYSYSSTSGTFTFTLCARLENAPAAGSPEANITGCGSCTAACNYAVRNP